MTNILVKLFRKLLKVQPSDMDAISSTAKYRSKIAEEAGSIYMVGVTIYLMFSINGWDPIVYISNKLSSWIPNEFGQVLLEVCLMFLSAKVVYDVIYKLVEDKNFNQWREENKDIWIKGTWLHIHDKAKVRIGDVLINQDLYTISVDGYNLALPQATSKSEISGDVLDVSDWYYSMAKIVDDEGENTLHGYYASIHGRKRKTGMHTLTFGEMKDYPVFMSGSFGDVVEENGQEVSNALGNLRLHKLTPDCPYYERIFKKTTGRVDYYQLVLVINEFYEARQRVIRGEDPQFENYDAYMDDEFMKDITDVIKRRGWAK